MWNQSKKALKKTLFKYYSNINENILITIDKVDTYTKFYLSSKTGGSLDVKVRDANFMSHIWKTTFLECKTVYTKKTAYLFIECPGVIQEEVMIEPYGEEQSLICIIIKKVDYTFGPEEQKK